MNLQHTAGNRAVQRMVQREWDDGEPDWDNLPSRGRSATIDASNSLREGQVTPHAERAAYVSAQGKKLQASLTAEKAQKAGGADWETRQAAFATSPGAALAPMRMQDKTASLVLDAQRARREHDFGPSEESRVLAEQAARKGGGAAASPGAQGGLGRTAGRSDASMASDLGVASSGIGGAVGAGVGGLGSAIAGNVSGATAGTKLTSQGLRDTGATGLTGAAGGLIGSGLKIGQASAMD
ncbi:MAG: hypothetical protein O2798_04825 [Chloroflexi bacterium]|nr:hypothetical protein [Chloroflexota bacterium]MDA1240150.1 hypothetical protein [Chloroflexota bacterium]